MGVSLEVSVPLVQCSQQFNKTPIGPSYKGGIPNILKYSSSAAQFGSSFQFWAPQVSFASQFPEPENFWGNIEG